MCIPTSKHRQYPHRNPHNPKLLPLITRMDPNLAASLFDGNNNLPTSNAPPANTTPPMPRPNAPISNAVPQIPPSNGPQDAYHNNFPGIPNNNPTPPPSYTSTPQDPFNTWPFTNSNSGRRPDPFNSRPFTNNNVPTYPNPNSGRRPGIRPPSNRVNMPGMDVFTRADGSSHVVMDDMQVFSGPMVAATS